MSPLEPRGHADINGGKNYIDITDAGAGRSDRFESQPDRRNTRRAWE